MPNPILAFTACLGAALLTGPADARDWVEYKSEHFTLYSDTTEQKAIEHLEGFEAFRLVALAMLGVNDEPEPVQPLIMLFESSKTCTT
jgi:hypothetical protein